MKFFGKIGFWKKDEEVTPGVFRPDIEEREYIGDIIKGNRSFKDSNTQNDIFNINIQISILSDLYAQQNWAAIRYVDWNGEKWKVTTIDPSYPRIGLSLGGVWNGEGRNEAEPSQDFM